MREVVIGKLNAATRNPHLAAAWKGRQATRTKTQIAIVFPVDILRLVRLTPRLSLHGRIMLQMKTHLLGDEYVKAFWIEK